MITHCHTRFHCWFVLLSLIYVLLNGCASNPNLNTTELVADSIQPPNTEQICDDPPNSTKLDATHLIDPLALNRKSNVNKSEPHDLWDRVRLGFRLDIPDDWRVNRELSRIVANPESLESGTKRAEPYLHFIVDEAEKRNMPLEIALLPAVESGFRPFARSNKAAVGLWQFMLPTAKEMGLKRNQWYEGRCDITASTSAALDYLQELADLFEGDWELALAAYNAGPGRVQRAIQSNQEKGLDTDFWSLPLPTETRNYVPKLLAIARILKDPEYHGVNLKPLPNVPYFGKITLSRPIPLHQAAKLANVDEAILSKLNPGIRGGVAGIGGYPLLLPIEKIARFEERLAQLESRQWTNTNQNDKPYPNHNYQVRSSTAQSTIATNTKSLPQTQSPITTHNTNTPRIHNVQRGEFLMKIARTYKLNHTQLAAWNNLSPKSGLFQGQILRLRPPGSDPASKSFSYKVHKGDSLKKIAKLFNVSIIDLKRWNDLDGETIQPGIRLKLYPAHSLTSSTYFIKNTPQL